MSSRRISTTPFAETSVEKITTLMCIAKRMSSRIFMNENLYVLKVFVHNATSETITNKNKGRRETWDWMRIFTGNRNRRK